MPSCLALLLTGLMIKKEAANKRPHLPVIFHLQPFEVRIQEKLCVLSGLCEYLVCTVTQMFPRHMGKIMAKTKHPLLGDQTESECRTAWPGTPQHQPPILLCIVFVELPFGFLAQAPIRYVILALELKENNSLFNPECGK